MDMLSRSHPDAAASRASPGQVLVWDAPVRVFHWLMVLSFAGAYLTAEHDEWRLVHITFGYTMAALVAFRLLWGLVGTRHARFASFVRGPASVVRYLKALAAGRPEHTLGHNPAGALAIVFMLLLAIVVTATGWATYHEVAGEALEEVHEVAANAMLVLVGIHVAAVLVSSRLHHENLVGAMISGRKQGSPEEGARSAWRSVAALLLALVLGFWWYQWQAAPGAAFDAPPAASQDAGQGDED